MALCSCGCCVRCRNNIAVRKWKLAHPDRLRAQTKRYAERNKERIARKNAKWARDNKEKVAARAARWRAANPEKADAVQAAFRERQRARLAPIREAKRAEALANRSRQAIATARCRARKLGLPLPEFPPKDPVRYEGICITCGIDVVRVKSDGRTDRCDKCRDHALNRIERASRRTREAQASPAWADSGAIAAIYQMASRATLCTGIPFHVDHVVPLRGRNVCGLHVPENLRVIPKHANLRKGNKLVAA